MWLWFVVDALGEIRSAIGKEAEAEVVGVAEIRDRRFAVFCQEKHKEERSVIGCGCVVVYLTLAECVYAVALKISHIWLREKHREAFLENKGGKRQQGK